MDLSEFFESINLIKINELINDGQEENLFLEFKTVENYPLNRSDKQNFAKALSGFANSSGGILVWGIVAKKDANGIDVATQKSPIPDVKKFLSDLNSLTGEYVTPIVDGVQHKLLQEKGSKDTGYVVSLIPESSSQPHMAMAGIGRYYKRSGDSFYQMEHFDLEQMFGRRPIPKIEFSISDLHRSRKKEHIIGLKNISKAIAKFPFLELEVLPPFHISVYGADGNGNFGLPKLKAGYSGLSKGIFGGTYEHVIHPGFNLMVTEVTLPEDYPPGQPVKLVINYRIQCEGMRPEEGIFEANLTIPT